MNDIFTWLTKYSPPVVLLISLGAILIFLVKHITEKAISTQFDKFKKEVRVDFPKSRYWRDGKGGTTDYGF
jgi:hypothetical protein